MAKKRETKQQPAQDRKPSHRLYRVIGDGVQASRTPIGATWSNNDGPGFSIIANAMPLQGRLMLRGIVEKAKEGQQ